MTAENSRSIESKRDLSEGRPLERVRDVRLPAADCEGGGDGGACDSGCGDVGCDCCVNVKK